MDANRHNVVSLSAYRARSDATANDNCDQRFVSRPVPGVVWPWAAIMALIGLICIGAVVLLP